MKKFTYIFVILIVLLITAGLTISRFVNFNHYKPFIEQKIGEYIDRKVIINGDIKLSILPVPSLNIYNATLASIPKATEANILSFKKLKININLWPLIYKKIEITHILISQPILTLEHLKNGQKNWHMVVKNKSIQDLISQDHDIKSAIAKESMHLSIDTVEIVGGKIVYLTPSGQHCVDDLTATLTCNSLQGPFKLNGFLKLADQDIRVQLKVKQLADIVPIKLRFDLDSVDINIEGIWTQSAAQFCGNINSKTNAKSFEATIQKFVPSFYLPDFITGPLSIEGRITAAENDLKIDNLTCGIDQESFDGRIEATYKPLSFNCALNGTPGHTDVLFNFKNKGSYQTGSLQLNTQSSRKLMKWLALSAVINMPDVFTGITNFKTNFLINDSQVKLDNIVLKIKDSMIAGVIDSNIVKNFCHYDITATGLVPLAEYLNIPIHHDPGAITINGTIAFQNDQFDYKNIINVAGLNVESTGTITRDKQPQIKMKMVIKTTDTQKLFDTFYDRTSFLENFMIVSDVTYDKKTLKFDNVKATANILGSSTNISGLVQIQNFKRQFIDAEFTIDALKIAGILPTYDYDDVKKIPRLKRDKRKELFQNLKIEDNSLSALPETAVQWSSLPINLSYLNNFDGKFKMTIGQLTLNNLIFENFTTSIALNKKVLDAPDIMADFYGGKIHGSVNLDSNDDLIWQNQMIITDAGIQNSSSPAGKINITRGNINAKSNFNSRGKSVRDWITNLQGRLHVDISDGIVSGFDLKLLDSKLKNISTIKKLMQTLKATMTSGKTDFNKMTATLNFDKGMGTVQNLSLTAGHARASGAGHIDFLHKVLELTGSFAFDYAHMPSFKMQISGPFDCFDKNFDTRDLEKFYIDQGLVNTKKIESSALKRASNIMQELVKTKKKPAISNKLTQYK